MGLTVKRGGVFLTTRSPNACIGACLCSSSEERGMSRLEIVIRFCVDRMVVVFLLAAANIGGGI